MRAFFDKLSLTFFFVFVNRAYNNFYSNCMDCSRRRITIISKAPVQVQAQTMPDYVWKLKIYRLASLLRERQSLT